MAKKLFFWPGQQIGQQLPTPQELSVPCSVRNLHSLTAPLGTLGRQFMETHHDLNFRTRHARRDFSSLRPGQKLSCLVSELIQDLAVSELTEDITLPL